MCAPLYVLQTPIAMLSARCYTNVDVDIPAARYQTTANYEETPVRFFFQILCRPREALLRLSEDCFSAVKRQHSIGLRDPMCWPLGLKISTWGKDSAGSPPSALART